MLSGSSWAKSPSFVLTVDRRSLEAMSMLSLQVVGDVSVPKVAEVVHFYLQFPFVRPAPRHRLIVPVFAVRVNLNV